MNILIKSAAGLTMLSFFAMAHAGPPIANAEPMDLDVDITAKILKEKSKRTTMPDGSAGSSSSSSDCGTVNINSNDKKSNSGIKGIMGNQSTTIITGPVINMAQCK